MPVRSTPSSADTHAKHTAPCLLRASWTSNTGAQPRPAAHGRADALRPRCWGQHEPRPVSAAPQTRDLFGTGAKRQKTIMTVPRRHEAAVDGLACSASIPLGSCRATTGDLLHITKALFAWER